MSDSLNAADAAIDPAERYLWDRTGPVDAAVALLERAAEPLRFRPVARLELRAPRIITRPVWVRALAVAAVLAIGFIILFMIWPAGTPSRTGTTWSIASGGETKIGEPRHLKKGSDATSTEMTTGPAGTLVLESAGGTKVRIGSGARIRVIESDPHWPWIEVDQGSLTIAVGEAARPLSFGVMGEKLTFAPGAVGTLNMHGKGSVGIDLTQGSAEAIIDDVATRLSPGMGVQVQPDGVIPVPVRRGSSAEFVARVRKLESSLDSKDVKSLYYVIEEVLHRAKPADAPTLWNLMARAGRPGRQAIRDALAKLVKAPPQPAYDAVLTLDQAALDAWWKAALEAK
jgi:hypothetical protein